MKAERGLGLYNIKLVTFDQQGQSCWTYMPPPFFFLHSGFYFPLPFPVVTMGSFIPKGEEKERVWVFLFARNQCPTFFILIYVFTCHLIGRWGRGSLGETGGCTVPCSCQQHKLWCPGMLIMCWSMVLVKAKHTLHMSNLHLKDGTLVPFLCSSTGCLVDWLVG